MTLKLWPYNKPLSLNGLGGGGVGSLHRPDTIPPKNYFPFDLERVKVHGKTPVYSFAGISSSPTTGFYMKPDGTAIYTMQTDNYMRKHSLGTAWDVSTGSYVHSSYQLLSTNASPHSGIGGSPFNSQGAYDSQTIRGVWFKNDGTKVYYANTQYIYETNLSVAWDISSLSSTYTQRYDFSSKLVEVVSGTGDYTIVSFYFKPDGSKLFLVTHLNRSGYSGLFPIGPNDSEALTYRHGYATGGNDSYIHVYNLSTNYDISTATHDYAYVVDLPYGGNRCVRGIGFSDDGTKIVMQGMTEGVMETIYGELSTGWDLSTISTNSSNYYYQSHREISEANTGLGMNIFFRTDSGYEGTRYYLPQKHFKIYQEEPKTGTYNINSSASSYIGWWITLSDSGHTNFVSTRQQPEAANNYIGAAYGSYDEPTFQSFTPDGTKLINFYNQYINIFDVTTPYDLRTINTGYGGGGAGGRIQINANSIYHYTSGRGSYPYQPIITANMRFNSDGSKVILGPSVGNYNVDYVFISLDMNTPYDFSSVPDITNSYNPSHKKTFIFDNAYNPGSQEFNNQGLNEKPWAGVCSFDGYHLYVVGQPNSGYSNNSTIYQYTMSTAFDLDTASYARRLVLTNQRVRCMQISPDGKQIIIGNDEAIRYFGYNGTQPEAMPYELISYNLSTAHDISTMTADKKFIVGNLGFPYNHYPSFPSNDGAFFIVDNGVDAAKNENGFYFYGWHGYAMFKLRVV